MKEIENYLLEYFKDLDLKEDQIKDLAEVCSNTAKQVEPLYKLMQKMAESSEFREQVINTIDETLTEDDNGIETDT